MISFWSVFSASLWFALASVMLYILRRYENFLMRYGVAVWYAIVILAVIRLLVPLDDAHMIILHSYRALPVLERVLQYELIKGVMVEQILVAIWLMGTLCGIMFIFYGLLRDRKRLRQLPVAELSSAVQNAISSCALDPANVRVTTASIVPMAVGLLHPTICLPDWEYSETELYWLLRHEATHISGRDVWLRLGFLLFRCLFWWNPFVHWGQRSVDDILELRCDKVVLDKATPSERVKYVEMLHYVASQVQRDSPSFVGAGMFVQTDRAGVLALRAKQALEAPRPCWGTTLTAIALCLGLFAASYAFILQPISFPPDMEDGIKIYPSSPESSYLKVLPNGDYERWCDGEFVEYVTANMRNDEAYIDLEVLP